MCRSGGVATVDPMQTAATSIIPDSRLPPPRLAAFLMELIGMSSNLNQTLAVRQSAQSNDDLIRQLPMVQAQRPHQL